MGGIDAKDGTEHLPVLIVGAGISGIGAGCALTRTLPTHAFAILDAFEDYGGTWRLHRYPGVRSDSDLFTYGYSFKPWRGQPIAQGDEILEYLGEAIEENGLSPRIRYGWRVLSADWDSGENLWRVNGVKGEAETPFCITCSFLWMCQGYYRHDRGHMPEWPGMGDFQGRIVHPQHWPVDLSYSGRRVVVVGSGATAVTLVPALAREAKHVTMLQRSPTYFTLDENRNAMAETLRELEVEDATIHDIVRRQVTRDQARYLDHVFHNPDAAAETLRAGLRAWMSPADIDAHFTPRYRPWQQRVAVAPAGDLFQAFKEGRASVVTDQIETFTADGLRLVSGRELPADIVVTATGFEMSTFGDATLSIDGQPLDLAKSATYRGMMFTGLPNLARTVGYLRLSSWTLRVELIADFVCRLLEHMERIGAARVEVTTQGDRPAAAARREPTGDSEFNATYLMRSLQTMPRSGPGLEWQTQPYWQEKDSFPGIDLEQDHFAYRDARGRPLRSPPEEGR
ncbi:MAG: NAD(P)/FAD-dependent oxidoreductase [Pseudomonadota bacterium]